MPLLNETKLNLKQIKELDQLNVKKNNKCIEFIAKLKVLPLKLLKKLQFTKSGYLYIDERMSKNITHDLMRAFEKQ